MASTFAPRRIRDGEELSFAHAVIRGFHGDGSDAILKPWVEQLRASTDYRAWVIAEGERIVGNLGVFVTDLSLPGGGAVPVAAITAVGVAQTHRRRGLLRSLMEACLDEARQLEEPVAALYASEAGIYERYGFGIAAPVVAFRLERAHARFRDPVDVRVVEGVDPGHAVEQFKPVLEEARRRRAGVGRTDLQWWMSIVDDAPDDRGGASSRRLVHVPGRGYAAFRIRSRWDDELPAGTVEVQELVATDPEAWSALWQFVCDIDLTATITAPLRPPDDVLLALLVEPMRAGSSPSMPLHARILDVVSAMESRRYQTPGQLVLRVHDDTGDAGGTWRLEVSQDGSGTCSPTAARPDVEVSIESLSAVWLGGVRATQLRDARRLVESSPGRAAALDRLLSVEVAPWTPFMF